MRYPVVMLLSALVLAACKAQPPLVSHCSARFKGERSGGEALLTHQYGPQASPIPLNSVQFADQPTAKSVAVQDLFVSSSAGQTVTITARFVNCMDTANALRIRTSFLGDDQAPLEPTSAWQTLVLQPHLTATYIEHSTSQSASKYLIEVLSNDRNGAAYGY